MTRATPEAPRRERISQRVIVGSVAAVAFGVRAVLLLTHPPALFPGSDNTWYDAVARSIEDGHLGRLPAIGGGHVLSIRFPPAYPVVLALARGVLFWVDSHDAHLWVGAALGALAAATVAALAWRLAGGTGSVPERNDGTARTMLAVVAGLLFALNPIVAGAAPSLMAEALVLPIVALVLLVTDRLVTGAGGTRDAVLLGALLAIGALTRSELIVLLGATVLGGFLASRARAGGSRPWVVAMAIGFAAALAWSVVISVAAERPVAMSANSGSLLLGANCGQTRAGAPDVGYWDVDCLAVPASAVSAETERRSRAQEKFLAHHFALPPQIGAPGEAEINSAQFDAATDQIADHPLETVAAVPVRVLRGLGLYWSPLQDKQEYFEGRDHGWEVVGRWFTILLVLPFALVTLLAALARRSRLGGRLRALVDARRLVPSLALMAAWVVTIALSYGSARFRAAIEPSLAVFAGIAITMLATALVQRRRTEAAS